jgi:hypothetical protein
MLNRISHPAHNVAEQPVIATADDAADMFFEN